jgi:DNA-binding NarL/FixJ family response regulator
MATMLDESVVLHRLPNREEAGRSAVILDSQPLMLAVFERALESVNVVTVGRHTTVEEALETIRDDRPDVFVVFLDGSEACAAGLESIRDARALVPEIKPIVLVDVSDTQTVAAAFEAGAVRAVAHSARTTDLALAVRDAFDDSDSGLRAARGAA